MRFSHRNVAWPFSSESILDTQPTADGNWGVLTREGFCAIIDSFGVEVSSRALWVEWLDMTKPVMLRLSRNLRFVVVAEEFGTEGCLFDLRTGEVLKRLTRGDYIVSQCSYPVAFFEFEGTTLLVHGTDWNRLELSDPLTGACLSDRPVPQFEKVGPSPSRCLDYFHSRLTVSPDQKRVFDNGWIWHPLGVPRTWSLEAWVSGNVWESEDGESVRELRTGGHMWDAPMAWLDSETVIVWGLGEELDEEAPLRPGVRVLDVLSGDEIATIDGVQVDPHALSPRNPVCEGWIAFDTWLYAVSPKSGTTVWDMGARTCLHHDPDFTPRHYHPLTRAFFSLDGAVARLSHLDL